MKNYWLILINFTFDQDFYLKLKALPVYKISP